METADLVKQLEEKWGVTAAAPVVAAAAAAPAGAPAEEAKTTFDVVLTSVAPDKKIAVIKAVREIKAGLGLAEAKALVEGAPKAVLEEVQKEDAEAILGALAELLPEAREMFRLLVEEEVGRQGLIEEYGLNKNTLDTRLHVFRKELRDLLKKRGVAI